MPTHDIRTYGAVGDGRTLCTTAVQRAIDHAHRSGGGTVVIPAGAPYVTGTLELRSGINLHVESGATLLGSPDPGDYRPLAVAGEYGGSESGFLITARDGEGVSITGGGTIDGRGREFMEGFQPNAAPYIYQPKAWRPRMFGLYGCRRLTVRDVTLRDAASWCLHLTGCDDVVISGVRILNDLAIPNCDGIDPDHCTNVRISDCHIVAGDDCIVVKATRQGRALGYCGSHNIVVTNCTCMSTSAAIKIGTESHADFSNIVVSNCVVRSSSRGLAIQLRDTANVEDVLFANCTVETRLFAPNWWGRAEPIYVTALPRHADTRVGAIRRVRFQNIRCRSENGIFVCGTADSPIEDLALEGIDLRIDKWSRWPGGMHDRRPLCGQEHGGLTEAPTDALYVEHARGVRIHDTRVRWCGTPQPCWGQGLRTFHVDGLATDRADLPDGPRSA